MVPGLELAAGYLIAWVVQKARRAGGRLNADADLILDTELNRLHDLVVSKLGPDPALTKLEQTAAAGMEVSDLTRRRVADALEQAADDDPSFSEQLTAVLSALKGIAPSVALAVGERSAAVSGDLHITADGGSAAAQTMGDVTLGSRPPDPPGPGRPGG